MTRARDHLAFTTTGKHDWLNELATDDGQPLIRLSSDPLVINGHTFALRPPPPRLDAEAREPALEFARPPAVRRLHPPLRLQPSAHAFSGTVCVAETVQLGPRITLIGDPDLQSVGEALHRFFAFDDPVRPEPARLALAGDMLRRWGAPQLAPGDLVEAADRLHAFLNQRHGGSARMREWPVYAAENLQVISGRIDLLIDNGECFAVIDHKSFPGVMALDDERLNAFGGQVDLYARALRQGAARECCDYWIHQPIAGLMVKVSLVAAEAV
jgi:ATP-dependent exoDNAse (exonuclease V) beta subunit